MAIELAFTDKEITPWGGLALMKRMLDRMEFDTTLEALPAPAPGSSRGYRCSQLLLQFMLSVWCGANRFEHCEVTRHDAVLSKLFGWSRMANFKAILRMFGRFDQLRNDAVFDQWFGWLFGQLHVGSLTLDLDSTVMTRYGTQQGAAKGYNPRKPGRRSHHPLLAFVADTQMVANFWLRPGNASSANNVVSFMQRTLTRLGAQRVELVRADSGFSDAAFLNDLEQRKIHYITALALRQPLQRALVRQRGWWSIDEPGAQGIELTMFDYTPPAWGRPRRVVAVRQRIDQRAEPKGKTLSLFAEDAEVGRYRWSAYVTDLDLPALAIWRLYRGRANCENRIKELKYDFGADSFCTNNFWATEAALSTVMMAHNLMSLFRQALLKTTPAHTLKTLRYKLFGVAGYLTHEGRRSILKLAMAMKRRAWFEGLRLQSANIDLPAKFSPVFSP